MSDVTTARSSMTSEPGMISAQLKTSKWFTRGWTLQELIAPRDLHFFNRSWESIGMLYELSQMLANITGIDQLLLRHFAGLADYSIAQRISGAAGRQTTRVEDRAYSLLGVFDINMPMLYGEGNKAFLRLQEEIIKTSTDQSILAWQNPEEVFGKGQLLASTPDWFTQSRGIISLPLENKARIPNARTSMENVRGATALPCELRAHNITSVGLELPLAFPLPSTPQSNELQSVDRSMAFLNCRCINDFDNKLALGLIGSKSVGYISDARDGYWKSRLVKVPRHCWTETSAVQYTLLREKPPQPHIDPKERPLALWFVHSCKLKYSIMRTVPKVPGIQESWTYHPAYYPGVLSIAVAFADEESGKSFKLAVGFSEYSESTYRVDIDDSPGVQAEDLEKPRKQIDNLILDGWDRRKPHKPRKALTSKHVDHSTVLGLRVQLFDSYKAERRVKIVWMDKCANPAGANMGVTPDSEQDIALRLALQA